MAGLFGQPSSATTNANALGDLSKDVALAQPPDDSISALRFNTKNDFLAVSSWDKQVRIYEVQSNGNSVGKSAYGHDQPVLDIDWSPDGTKLASAGADKVAKLLDLNTGQNAVVAGHDQPIRCCRFVEVPSAGGPILATGSWDKTVKYWDLRTPNPIATLQCQERVYTMDSRNNLLVIGTADRYINIVNLSDPTKFYKTMQSPLKWQTRVVSCFIDASGFGVGSIEGRCAMQYVEEKDSSSNFSFKCHRDAPSNNITNVYAVNAISWHPVHGTFSTAGSDGTFHFWDKDAKHRLKGYPNVGGSISATAFSRTGDIFAYAVSYDWSKGYQNNNQQLPNKVMLHGIVSDECKPRPSVKKTR